MVNNMANATNVSFTPRTELVTSDDGSTAAIGKPMPVLIVGDGRDHNEIKREEVAEGSFSWLSCSGPRSCAGAACDGIRKVPEVMGKYVPDTEAIRRSLDVRKWSGYESVVNAIVRPPRAYYNYGSMGPLSLSLHGMRYQRQDLVLVNDRAMRHKATLHGALARGRRHGPACGDL